METLHLPPPPPPPPVSLVPSPVEFLSPLYYGLIVVGIAGIVLVIYNFIIVLYCAPRRIRTPPQNLNGSIARTSRGFEISDNTDFISTFKYSKEPVASDQKEGDSDKTSFQNECVVCLSPYKDGQDVRKLVQCRHSFHAPCIDKWLHSRSDCPICRSDLTPASSQRFQQMPEEANPTGELPVSGSTLV